MDPLTKVIFSVCVLVCNTWFKLLCDTRGAWPSVFDLSGSVMSSMDCISVSHNYVQAESVCVVYAIIIIINSQAVCCCVTQVVHDRLFDLSGSVMSSVDSLSSSPWPARTHASTAGQLVRLSLCPSFVRMSVHQKRAVLMLTFDLQSLRARVRVHLKHTVLMLRFDFQSLRVCLSVRQKLTVLLVRLDLQSLRANLSVHQKHAVSDVEVGFAESEGMSICSPETRCSDVEVKFAESEGKSVC